MKYLQKIIPNKRNYSYSNIAIGKLIPANSFINIIEINDGDFEKAKQLDSLVRGEDINY